MTKRNDKCPCGSDKKYKNCCLDIYKTDEKLQDLEETVKNAYKEVCTKFNIPETQRIETRKCTKNQYMVKLHGIKLVLKEKQIHLLFIENNRPIFFKHTDCKCKTCIIANFIENIEKTNWELIGYT